MTEGQKGVLYLCATPIGNLEDITMRALRVLREVDLIAAEDTRHTRKLLSRYDIHTGLTSYHRHNMRAKGPVLLDLLRSGKNIALVSDAGMPGVSDQGSELVGLALREGCGVTAIPGPSAGITALVVSGLPTESFIFIGFLPSSAKARREKLRELQPQQGTLIFYEAPHRLRATLADLYEVLGDRAAAAARELTKLHEEIIRGSLAELVEHFREKEPRGEFTLVVDGAGAESPAKNEPEWLHLSPAAHVALIEAKGAGRKDALREVARLRGISRREVYQAVLEKET
ncbi:Ribosomal RNA small subunit methyltransferase I [Pelotomaculum sp. FP]|uniref:16S rRNA (cytidine(1402)-2'-O)-methyltransferase n=1 Tax=Pelotomaculum sp. FP TaxID=261474 RepID=UPI0010661461|nr:16S rRNA (cytidine(1402)-2'-O)-methyltransferase [Pelotomaculum sp. FP]TEB11868.1 Ribosomal RNA small subunit methyltransferase I [Pelotomaculum sp. FP]